jgi:hypothetical protein
VASASGVAIWQPVSEQQGSSRTASCLQGRMPLPDLH